MASLAPPWIAHTEALDDRDRYAVMTAEERLVVFCEVCELARVILSERPDRSEVLQSTEPMPAVAEAAWRRILIEARRAPPAR